MAQKERSDKKGKKFKKGQRKYFSYKFSFPFSRRERKIHTRKAKEDNSIIIHQLLYPWIHS